MIGVSLRPRSIYDKMLLADALGANIRVIFTLVNGRRLLLGMTLLLNIMTLSVLCVVSLLTIVPNKATRVLDRTDRLTVLMLLRTVVPMTTLGARRRLAQTILILLLCRVWVTTPVFWLRLLSLVPVTIIWTGGDMLLSSCWVGR